MEVIAPGMQWVENSRSTLMRKVYECKHNEIEYSEAHGEVIVILHGKGIALLTKSRRIKGNAAWIAFLKLLLKKGFHFTRVDFAFDCNKEVMRYPFLRMCGLPEGEVHRKAYIHKVRAVETIGNTVMLGGEDQPFRVRVYRKVVELPILGTDRNEWMEGIRFEVQLRKEKARYGWACFEQDGVPGVLAYLRTKLSFPLAPVTDSNKRRTSHPEQPWWSEFTAAGKGVQLTVAPDPSSDLWERALRYLRQFLPTAAFLARDRRFGPEKLFALILNCRLRPEVELFLADQIEDELLSQGLSPAFEDDSEAA